MSATLVYLNIPMTCTDCMDQTANVDGASRLVRIDRLPCSTNRPFRLIAASSVAPFTRRSRRPGALGAVVSTCVCPRSLRVSGRCRRRTYSKSLAGLGDRAAMSEAGTSRGNDRAAMPRFAGSHETRWESQTLDLHARCSCRPCLKLAHRDLASRIHVRNGPESGRT